ncbi:MAG: hypothetical protein ACE5EH_10450 [Gammaproteobacteria bacterium]
MQSGGGTKQGNGSTNGSLGQRGQGGYLNGQNRCGGGGGYGTVYTARGGGGGSGFINPTGTSQSMTMANGRGYTDGQVVISWITTGPLKGAVIVVE